MNKRYGSVSEKYFEKKECPNHNFYLSTNIHTLMKCGTKVYKASLLWMSFEVKIRTEYPSSN